MAKGIVEVRTIDLLLDTLSSVKILEGRIQVDAIWASIESAGEVPPTSCEPPSLDGLKSSLRILKASRDALNVLLRTFDEAVHITTEKCLPLSHRHGINSLPPEILAAVFELGLPTPEKVEQDWVSASYSMRMSHVCQRFRDIALSTPRLWSYVHCRQGKAEIAAFLSRSRNTDLTLSISHRKILNVFTAHSHRWTELRICCDLPCLLALTSTSVTLPRIKTITTKQWECYGNADAMWVAIFNQWTLGGLLHFSGVNVIPYSLGNQLRESSLALYDGEYAVSVIAQHLRCLRNCPHLETLTIGFEVMKGLDNDPDSLPSEKITLGITTLCISLGEQVSLTFFQDVFLLLHCPKVSHVTLRTHTNAIDTYGKFGDYLRLMLSGENPYPALQHVDIDIDCYRVSSHSPFAGDLLSTLTNNVPSLRCLTLKGETTQWWIGEELHDYAPPLETLRLDFRPTNDSRHWDLEQFAKRGALGRLEVVGLDEFPPETLKRMREILGDRLHCIT